jgi:hypothetical protein
MSMSAWVMYGFSDKAKAEDVTTHNVATESNLRMSISVGAAFLVRDAKLGCGIEPAARTLLADSVRGQGRA